MKATRKIIAVLLLLGALLGTRSLHAGAAGEPEIEAKAAILMDTNTQTVIYEKNAHDRLPIASMTKIMALCLVFEAVEAGELGMDDGVLISAHAKEVGGSHVFTELNDTYPAQDMIKSVIIASANDACVALAEHLAGSESAFVAKMNEKAQAWGLKDTQFINCTGMPAEGHVSSAYDIARMSAELLKHPGYFQWSRVWMDQLTHRGGRITELTNTNRLVRFFEGCDGVKTGYTTQAGFCVSASVMQGELRLVSVIIGGQTSQERFDEARQLIHYGFRHYTLCQPVPKGTALTPIPLEKSVSKYAEISADGFYAALMPKGEEKGVEAVYELPQKLSAPLKKGEKVGEILICRGGEVLSRIPVVSAREYPQITLWEIVGKLVGRE